VQFYTYSSGDRYKAGIKLAGIIYMHRITDGRPPCRSLRLVGEMCGDKAIKKVMLVTTMWDRVDQETGKRREDELMTRFWTKMIKCGAACDRFDNSESSAWRIIQYFVRCEALREVLLLQKELVDLKKHFNETTVGMVLWNELLESREKQKQALIRLECQAQQNPNLAEAVEAEKVRAEANIEHTFKQFNAMKISFSRRVAVFFKKPPKGVRIVKCYMCIFTVLVASLGCYRSLKLSFALNAPLSYLQHYYVLVF